jgi:hypothetical protein
VKPGWRNWITSDRANVAALEVTSRGSDRADPAQPAGLIRGHWSVHCTRGGSTTATPASPRQRLPALSLSPSARPASDPSLTQERQVDALHIGVCRLTGVHLLEDDLLGEDLSDGGGSVIEGSGQTSRQGRPAAARVTHHGDNKMSPAAATFAAQPEPTR